MNGTKKKQNANKTFAAAPTLYQHIETGKVEFGPTSCIFESAAKRDKFSSTFVKELKKLKLNHRIYR